VLHFEEAHEHIQKGGGIPPTSSGGSSSNHVQEAAAYQRLRELADKAEMLEFLGESKAGADAGRTVPAREFLENLGKRKRPKRA
jgi:hypothetical protein